MDLELAHETWQSLKGFINPIDQTDAAQALVSALIDCGVDADDIQSTFTNDTHVKKALDGWTNNGDSDDLDYHVDDDDLD